MRTVRPRPGLRGSPRQRPAEGHALTPLIRGRRVNKSQRNRTSRHTRRDLSLTREAEWEQRPWVCTRPRGGGGTCRQAADRACPGRRAQSGLSACRRSLGSTRVAPPRMVVSCGGQRHRPRPGEPPSAPDGPLRRLPPAALPWGSDSAASPAAPAPSGPSRSERAPEVSDKPTTGRGPWTGRCPRLLSSGDRWQPPEEGADGDRAPGTQGGASPCPSGPITKSGTREGSQGVRPVLPSNQPTAPPAPTRAQHGGPEPPGAEAASAPRGATRFPLHSTLRCPRQAWLIAQAPGPREQAWLTVESIPGAAGLGPWAAVKLCSQQAA